MEVDDRHHNDLRRRSPLLGPRQSDGMPSSDSEGVPAGLTDIREPETTTVALSIVASANTAVKVRRTRLDGVPDRKLDASRQREGRPREPIRRLGRVAPGLLQYAKWAGRPRRSDSHQVGEAPRVARTAPAGRGPRRTVTAPPRGRALAPPPPQCFSAFSFSAFTSLITLSAKNAGPPRSARTPWSSRHGRRSWSAARTRTSASPPWEPGRAPPRSPRPAPCPRCARAGS